MFHLNPGNNSDNTVLCRQEESLVLLLMLTNDSTEMRDKVLCQDVSQRIHQAGRKRRLRSRDIHLFSKEKNLAHFIRLFIEEIVP